MVFLPVHFPLPQINSHSVCDTVLKSVIQSTTKQQNNNNSNSSNNIIINNNKAKSRCAQARSSPSGYTLRLGHLEMQCTAVASWGQRCFISESIQALPIASSVFNFSNLQILQSESQFKLSWSLHFWPGRADAWEERSVWSHGPWRGDWFQL